MTPDSPRCPSCNARLLPHPQEAALWCQFCGASRDDSSAQNLASQRRAEAQRLTYDPPYRDWNLDSATRDLLNHAWTSIQDGDRRSAAYMLGEMTNTHPGLADVWYLLSLTTDDRAERLGYLLNALQAQPYHEYAWRDKGILEGAIPPGDAPPLPDPAPADPVPARSDAPACPLCGGQLALDATLGALRCAHCGHRPGALPTAWRGQTGGYRKLEHAQLRRRFGFSQEWRIGARVLICQNCHAQLSLGADVLATRCPFCDSAHVVVRDAVGSFEAPDALLPFALDRAAAARAVHERAPDALRCQVARGTLVGVYLPFWAFASTVFVLAQPDAPALLLRPGVYAVSDALVSGVARPPEAVLAALMPYDLAALIPYDPRILAHWSAQLYSIDAIQASLTARAHAQYQARCAASHSIVSPPAGDLARRDSHDYAPPASAPQRGAQTTIDEIHYRLILLPVWLVTLDLGDGSHLPAYVNGQTGEAILSGSFAQPERIVAGPASASRPPLAPLPRRHTRHP